MPQAKFKQITVCSTMKSFYRDLTENIHVDGHTCVPLTHTPVLTALGTGLSGSQVNTALWYSGLGSRTISSSVYKNEITTCKLQLLCTEMVNI